LTEISSLERMLLEIRKKSRYALLATMMNACKKPKTKYEVYLKLGLKYTTYAQLKSLLATALKLKLLEKKDSQYVTTEKGKTYAKKFRRLLKLLQEE